MFLRVHAVYLLSFQGACKAAKWCPMIIIEQRAEREEDERVWVGSAIELPVVDGPGAYYA